jgi:hypothetical protein
LVLCVIAAIVVASVVFVLPAARSYFGPPPVWHSFSGVFDSETALELEGCTVQGLLNPINTAMGKVYSGTVVTCSYHGASYTGYFGTDCNMVATGRIPAINGTLVPYEGCVLSMAPLDYDFVGIYTLGTGSNSSIPIYSNQKVSANMTASPAWKTFGCSLTANNATKSNGPMSCRYLGVPYQTSNIQGACNLGIPIEVSGVPVPTDSCILPRAEVVSG